MSKTEETHELAAAKAGMDVKTARKYLKDGKLPSESQPERTWRTRKDPFERVWNEIQKQVEGNPGLEAKTVFEALQRKYPGEFRRRATPDAATAHQTVARHGRSGPGGVLRAAACAGRLGESDFTPMTELGITIAGQSFPHLLYHFVLAYSNWEDATVCYSESFESLSEGLQNALWELGGAPLEHRTDRLSTAVNNMTDAKEFTARYEGLLRQYRMEGQTAFSRDRGLSLRSLAPLSYPANVPEQLPESWARKFCAIGSKR